MVPLSEAVAGMMWCVVPACRLPTLISAASIGSMCRPTIAEVSVASRAATCNGSVALCGARSEEHTSELQSLMRISYAVFCLKKKKTKQENTNKPTQRTSPNYTHHRTIDQHEPTNEIIQTAH